MHFSLALPHSPFLISNERADKDSILLMAVTQDKCNSIYFRKRKKTNREKLIKFHTRYNWSGCFVFGPLQQQQNNPISWMECFVPPKFIRLFSKLWLTLHSSISHIKMSQAIYESFPVECIKSNLVHDSIQCTQAPFYYFFVRAKTINDYWRNELYDCIRIPNMRINRVAIHNAMSESKNDHISPEIWFVWLGFAYAESTYQRLSDLFAFSRPTFTLIRLSRYFSEGCRVLLHESYQPRICNTNVCEFKSLAELSL